MLKEGIHAPAVTNGFGNLAGNLDSTAGTHHDVHSCDVGEHGGEVCVIRRYENWLSLGFGFRGVDVRNVPCKKGKDTEVAWIEALVAAGVTLTLRPFDHADIRSARSKDKKSLILTPTRREEDARNRAGRGGRG